MDAVLASSSATLRAPTMRGAASLASSSQDLRLGAMPLRVASAASAPESSACARRSAPGSCRAEGAFPLGPIIAAAAAAKGGLTYKDSGVDIDAGNELVKRIAKMTPGIGGFGGVFPFGALPLPGLAFPSNSQPLFLSSGRFALYALPGRKTLSPSRRILGKNKTSERSVTPLSR